MPISQREAQRLRKRIRQLEQDQHRRCQAYASDWPGGVWLGSIAGHKDMPWMVQIHTARKLGRGVVAVPVTDGSGLHFYAVPLS